MTMMESISKQKEEQKDNNDMNLGISLNIVAVQDDNANSKKKRKRKLNKYDKRRRRKEAAEAAAAGATKEDDGRSKAEDDEKAREDNLNEKEDNDIRPPQEQQDKEEVDGKGDKNGSEKEAPEGNKEEDTNETETKTVTKDDEDHAAYMAEYHARPLELDRRSGATITNINKATKRRKKSSHQEESTTETATDSGSDVFSKETEWKDMNLDSKIVNLLPHSKPTKIQEIVIRKILTTTKNNNNEHTNFWIQSETGSGKTLAYFLPILQHLWQNLNKQQTNHKNQNKKIDRASLGTQCLIICPTQELVQQTQQACEQLATKLCAGQLVVGILRGQANKTKEKARIRKGLGVLVSTPGRLLDHLQTTACLQTAVRKLQWLVLDEVDRLFDMGLSPQLKQVVELLQQFAGKNKWRSTLVSATVPPEVKETVQELLSTGKASEWAWIQQQQQQPQRQTIGSNDTMNDHGQQQGGGGRSLPKQLVQYHILVSAKLRLTTLIAFLSDRVHNNERTVVFLSTCASVDYLHELFQKMDCILKGVDETKGGLFGSSCSVDRLHGNVPHQERQSILESFTQPRTTSNNKNNKKTPQARILLATDVAARGLNLHADWTVQYDPPCEIADYIHRAGRVARAGQMGQSLLFLLPSEKSLLGILQLKQNSEKAIPAVSLTSTLQQAAKLCPDVMRAGLQRNGMMSKSNTKDISMNTSSSSSSSRGGGSRQGEAFCSELQYRLEECVLEQSKAAQKQLDKESRNNNKKKRKRDNAAAAATLLDMARAAFLSHMRAYPTKEKLVRHIFSARALHLGHIAKSFALREPPKTLVKNSKGSGAGGWGNNNNSNNNKKKRNATSSFGKQGDNHDSDEEFATTNGKTAAQKRAMLMANAAKLQMGGVDGF